MCQSAIDEMYKMMNSNFGNPSSRHDIGNNALDAMKLARSRVAKAIGCKSEEIIFTPSGTCANNTAIFGAVKAMKRYGKRIITSSLEHPSVNEPMKALENMGFEVIRLPADKSGKISLNSLRNAVNQNTVFVSVMAVNNETGAINPISDAVKTVRNSNPKAIIHCDAVQAFGKMNIKPSKLGVDMLTVSSHKIHGPKGAGALYIRNGLRIPPYILGGGQEGGMFSGTEATPAIVGFGAAASSIPELNMQSDRIKIIRNRFCEQILADPRIYLNSPDDALPYVINISVPGIPSEVLINYLSENGICVSAGSACKKGHRSEVLTAMGFDSKRIDSAIRISLSRYTTSEDMDMLYQKIKEATARFLR